MKVSRRLALLTSASVVAVLLAVGAWGSASIQAGALALLSEPGIEDGRLSEVASLDSDQPAIAQLDPALLAAMRSAQDAYGSTFEVTSGWRSARYQQALLDDAVETYGSLDEARRWVAPADRSRHVTGDAIDIGPVDAQFWLMQYGGEWGLCQIYANERWHFELATVPGGVCPDLLEDAAG